MEDSYETTVPERAEIINGILASVPKSEQDDKRGTLEWMALAYCGAERRALSVLRVAADQGKLPEYIDRFHEFYAGPIQHIVADMRMDEGIARTARLAQFFEECYRDLGIPYSDN